MSDDERYERLKSILARTGGALVAFSGGVDSTLVAKAAADALGERALAVTVRSKIHPRFELDQARELAREIGIRHREIGAEPLEIEQFRANPPERCYICKKALFSKLLEVAREEGLAAVVEGSNVSDEGDYRPGMRALEELEVRSPLREAGLEKPDVRELSRLLGLPTHDRPAYACLATRIPHGEEITAEKLAAIERAEEFLRERGYRVLRVRCHGDAARIELGAEELMRFAEKEDFAEVAEGIRRAGFRYAALDLEGYRTGSMNPPGRGGPPPGPPA